MIDNKKIEEAARYYCDNRYPASQDAPFIAEGFRHGAKWMREEFLKDLLHPAKETACDTYQEMREIRVRAYTFTDWIFVDELLDLITKGGENERV